MTEIQYIIYRPNIYSSIMISLSLQPFTIKKVIVLFYIFTFNIFGIFYDKLAMINIIDICLNFPFIAILIELLPMVVHKIAYCFLLKDYFCLVISKSNEIAYYKINMETYSILNHKDKNNRIGKKLIIVQTLVVKFLFCLDVTPIIYIIL